MGAITVNASEAEQFRQAVAAIEAAAASYDIAGLRRVAGTIFGPLKADDWTFHHGGRHELQFNVGIDLMPDGSRAFRAGVAFSFEPS